MRDGIDYEFTIVLDIDLKHHATASKDRTGLFIDKPEFTITPATGEAILNWCNSEVANEVKVSQPINQMQYGRYDFTPGAAANARS